MIYIPVAIILIFFVIVAFVEVAQIIRQKIRDGRMDIYIPQIIFACIYCTARLIRVERYLLIVNY